MCPWKGLLIAQHIVSLYCACAQVEGEANSAGGQGELSGIGEQGELNSAFGLTQREPGDAPAVRINKNQMMFPQGANRFAERHSNS
jgi:hypothetical protein